MGLDFIVGGLGHGQMKIRVVLNHADCFSILVFIDASAFFKPGDIIICGSFSGMIGIPGLDGLSDFDQLENGLEVLFYRR